jgi:hypothetical protein
VFKVYGRYEVRADSLQVGVANKCLVISTTSIDRSVVHPSCKEDKNPEDSDLDVIAAIDSCDYRMGHLSCKLVYKPL